VIPVIPSFSGWVIMVADDGLWIAPVYRGQFGCRLYHQETLGL
jgi:hypothetical protein